MPGKPIPHGTVQGYHRCNRESAEGSCQPCRAALNAYQRELRARRRAEDPDRRPVGRPPKKPGEKAAPREKPLLTPLTDEELFVDPKSFKHGTMNGYNKCLKTPDGPCEQCLEASRVKSRTRRESSSSKKVAAAQGSSSFQDALLEEPVITETVDELAEARENLRIVRAAMNAARSPRDMAPLSKQRVELVKLITDLERARGEEDSTIGSYADTIGNVLRADFGHPDAPDQLRTAR